MSMAMHEGRTRPTLHIITACYNEEPGIEHFYRQLKSVLDSLTVVQHRIVFVDDGSDDGTLARLKAIAHRDPTCNVYALSRNFGHQAAITCGLHAARDADAVVVMDSDLQHPPSIIPGMVERWRAGYDVVQAIRQQSPGASPIKRLTSALFYWLFNRLSEVPLPKGAADFYLLSRRARDALMAMPERSRFLRGMVAWIGFQRTAVSYDAPPRSAGVSKYTRPRMTRLAMDGLLSFSARPIRLATRAGLLLVLVGGVYLSYILGRWVLLGDLVQGWPSLISIVLILGGAQILFIGLLGEYVARVFDESKQRPLYLVKQAPADEARPEGQEPQRQ
jgi:dolichol-phosphate mannosyltransferase